MERLTERTDIGIVGNNAAVKNYPLYKVAEYDELDRGITGQCFDKLAEYEDLEEQGLLLRLPCKAGDTVYHIANKRILEVENVDLFFLCLCVAECRFGKSVFLTQAEAEQKLKEMKDDYTR